MSRNSYIACAAMIALPALVVGHGLMRAPANAQGAVEYGKEATPIDNGPGLHVCKALPIKWAAVVDQSIQCRSAPFRFEVSGQQLEERKEAEYFCSAKDQSHTFKTYPDGRQDYTRLFCTFPHRPNPFVAAVWANEQQCNYIAMNTPGSALSKDMHGITPDEYIANHMSGEPPFSTQQILCPIEVQQRFGYVDSVEGTRNYLKQCYHAILTEMRNETGDQTLGPCAPSVDKTQFTHAIRVRLELDTPSGGTALSALPLR